MFLLKLNTDFITIRGPSINQSPTRNQLYQKCTTPSRLLFQGCPPAPLPRAACTPTSRIFTSLFLYNLTEGHDL